MNDFITKPILLDELKCYYINLTDLISFRETSIMFTWQAKVRNYELDNQNIVNNATYLNYLEQARAELVDQSQLDLNAYEQMGYHFVVAKINIEYKRSLFANDAFYVEVAIEKIEQKRLVFHQKIFKTCNNKCVADAYVYIACMNIKTRRAEMPDCLASDLGMD